MVVSVITTERAVGAIAKASDDGYISSMEMLRLTGISYRRLDYWYTSGVFGTPTLCGSGHSRMWHESLVKQIQLLLEISEEFGHYNNTSIVLLKRIIENYYKGSIQFSPNTRLEWEV